MIPFAIAALQLHVSAERSNIEHIRTRVDTLMHLYPWVQMVVLSELAPFGPLKIHAEPLPGPTEAMFQSWAARHRIWFIPGSMYEHRDGLIYNTASVINPEGEVVARHRKMFPFLPYEEGVALGDEFVVFDVPGIGRFGLSICYDMWFPETTRTLAAMGAEVIIHPTMTPTIDRDVELAIARATAATNQCFMFDVNGAGDGGNGRSIIVGPFGDVLYQAGHGEEMMPIEIDVARVRRSREFGFRGLGQPLKSFRDRRVEFDVYSRERPLDGYLRTLGTLAKPVRGSRVGIDGHVAGPAGAHSPLATPQENS